MTTRLPTTMQTEVITMSGAGARPPSFSIEYARTAAAGSPCHHSKRGVSVYKAIPQTRLPADQELAQETWVDGCNGPPWEWDENMNPIRDGLCDGSWACVRDCAKRCVHAEQRALFAITQPLWREPHLLRMVHVKIDGNHQPTAGKGPSCGDCSKLLLDMGIGGIWLYEVSLVPDRSPDLEGSGVLQETSIWRYYPMVEFHKITCINVGIHQVPT